MFNFLQENFKKISFVLLFNFYFLCVFLVRIDIVSKYEQLHFNGYRCFSLMTRGPDRMVSKKRGLPVLQIHWPEQNCGPEEETGRGQGQGTNAWMNECRGLGFRGLLAPHCTAPHSLLLLCSPSLHSILSLDFHYSPPRAPREGGRPP
jgi:hypothetical protein